jgi:hypothetical protein
MATTQDILANEARKQELRISIAQDVGRMDATSSVMARLVSVNSDAQITLDEKRAELAALEAGGGQGVTDSYGPKSAITQLIEAEREAAKSAAIDYVKANVECTETDAAQAWDAAALAAHPEFPHVIQSGAIMVILYRANMVKGTIISDDTWEAQRAWVLATDKAAIMAM